MNPTTLRNVLLVSAAAVSASVGAPFLARSRVAPTAVSVAEKPASAITRAVSRVAQPSAQSYPGFDTNVYPGDNAMDAWRQSGQYQWVGYYLPAPCHKNSSWAGKRKRLVETGWGLAVIYVGQQTWGKPVPAVSEAPPPSSPPSSMRNMSVRSPEPNAKPGDNCSPSLVGAAQGQADADDAIRVATNDGFEKGTVIFLDVERMENIPPAMREYYRAWTQHLLGDGRFVPGFYAHTHNAAEIYNDVRELFTAAGVKSDPNFWIAGTRGFDIAKRPTDVGHAFADVWQGLLDVVRTQNGIKLPIDVSVSAVPSPSSVSSE